MSKEQTDLQVVPPSSVDIQKLAENPAAMAGTLLQAVIKGGITPENTAVVEKVIDLMERLDARRAEREHNAAFAELQKNIPKIKAMKNVESKGKLLYTYAPYEDIMEQLQPLLTQFGFSVSFETGTDGDRVTQACVVRHKGGHKELGKPFGAKVGSGPPNSSPAQGDGAASTYAKRFALCNMFNIIIEKDTDGRAIGQPISPDEARALQARVKACSINEPFFLQFAQVILPDGATPEQIADGYYKIGSSIVPQLEKMLKGKEAKKGATAA